MAKTPIKNNLLDGLLNDVDPLFGRGDDMEEQARRYAKQLAVTSDTSSPMATSDADLMGIPKRPVSRDDRGLVTNSGSKKSAVRKATASSGSMMTGLEGYVARVAVNADSLLRDRTASYPDTPPPPGTGYY
jgi:hypothetical protein